uniref:Transmembrane protein n=1 Tax=Medicago truncatula TaxID=3880 RepID=I3SUB7_MEDTR|nr:unknown [Medicago truncatula]
MEGPPIHWLNFIAIIKMHLNLILLLQ